MKENNSMNAFRLAGIGLLGCLLAMPLAAQKKENGSITAAASSCTPGVCVQISLPANSGALAVDVSGTFSATLQFEASADGGSTWRAINGYPLNSSTGVSSTTSGGAWQFPVSGLTNVRVRGSSYSSGTAVVVMQSSQTSASLNRGGGGGEGTPGGSNTQIQFNDSGSFGGAPLWREDANTISQRNSTNAQNLDLYSTFTDASNYARMRLGYAASGTIHGTSVGPANILKTQEAGTGVIRPFLLQIDNPDENFISSRSISGFFSAASSSTALTHNFVFLGDAGGQTSGTRTSATTIKVENYGPSSGGTVTALSAIEAGVINDGGTVGSIRGVSSVGGGAADDTGVTNRIGLHVHKQRSSNVAATNNYGLYFDDQGTSTNDYAIYVAGGKSFFAGGLYQANNATFLSAAKASSGNCTVKLNTSDQWEFDCPLLVTSAGALNLSDFTNSSPATGDLWRDDDSVFFRQSGGNKTFAFLESPSFTTPSLGAATATTPSAEDNDTSVATTAFVRTELNNQQKQKDGVLLTPADGDDALWFKAQKAMTITDIHCIVDPADSSESISLDIQECNSSGDSCSTVDAAITCDNDGAEDDGSLSNASIDAGDWVKFVVGAPSGTVSALTWSVYYTEAE